MRHARFFFDAGSGGVLWAGSADDRERYGNPVDLARLPIGDALRAELTRLIEAYDGSVNWSCPPDPGPWREPECARFHADVCRALRALRAALGPGWAIADEVDEVHEDPDLDRYLADPDGFRR